MRVHPDTAALDWLNTFASSIEFDDITGLWTVHSREPGYPAGRGRSIRKASMAAMDGAERADAAEAHRRYVSREAVRLGCGA